MLERRKRTNCKLGIVASRKQQRPSPILRQTSTLEQFPGPIPNNGSESWFLVSIWILLCLNSRMDIHGRIALARIATAAGTPYMDCCYGKSSNEQQPLNGSKHSRGLRNLASVPSVTSNVAEESGQSNPAGKPEEHGQKLDGEDGVLVSCLGEAQRGQRQVDDGQKGPYRGEEEEFGLRRRPGVVACAGPVMHDVRHQTKNQESKEGLGSPQGERECVGHDESRIAYHQQESTEEESE